jgi:hypothetical protein
MERAISDFEVPEIYTDRVPLQGDTSAFRDLVQELKQRYPRQVEMDLEG